MPKTPAIRIPITAEDKTRAAFKGAATRAQALTRTIGGLTAAVGALAGAGGFLALINAQRQVIDNLGKMSDRLNVATPRFAAFALQAKLTGTSAETVNVSLERMVKRLGEASTGMGAAKPWLDRLGLSAAELVNLRADEAYLRIADSIANLSTHSQRAAATAAIFGREAIGMINMLSEGRAGFEAASDMAERFGTAIGRGAARKVEAMNDQIVLLDQAFEGFKNTLTILVSGPLTRFFELLGGRTAFVSIERGEEVLGKLRAELQRFEGTLSAFEKGDKFARGVLRLLGDDPDEVREKIEQTKRDIEFVEKRLAVLRGQQASSGGAAGGVVLESERDKTEAQKSMLKERLDALANFEIEHKQTTHERLRNLEDEHLQASSQTWSKYSDFVMMSSKEQAETVLGEMINMTAGVAQHSRTMFKINKVAAIANAIMDAHAGAARTMREYPYPINVGLAALSYAAGLARVQAIRSTSFAGGGGGSTPSAAGTVPTINDNPLTPTAEPARQATNVTINLGDAPVFSQDAVRSLLDSINEALGDGARLRFAS